jgi:predicted GNAT family N-acyltransferase
MTFTQIEFASTDYRQECALRDAILRAPLGLWLTEEDIAGEQAQWHFGLFAAAGALIACVIVAPLSPTSAKIRQMAVARERQGQGYGRRLLREVERVLTARGITTLVLHARATAVDFYAKLGYTVVGEAFVEVTLPHSAMEKRIDAARKSNF